MLGITLRQLEAFVAVAETGGFRRAAERLNLSRSAATTHVKALEDQLGVRLFHRTLTSQEPFFHRPVRWRSMLTLQ